MGNNISKPYLYEIGFKSTNVVFTESNIEITAILEHFKADTSVITIGTVLVSVPDLEYIKQRKNTDAAT